MKVLISYIKLLAGFFALFAFLVACQKNNSNNSSLAPIAQTPFYPNGVVPGTCAQCTFPQAQLFQATSQGTNTFPVTINWQFIGDQSSIQQTLALGLNPQKTYSGPIYARGGLTISPGAQTGFGNATNGALAGYCQIPAGQYTINPLQPGNMSVGSFSLPQFEAIQGPVRIVFALSQAVVIDPNADGNVDRVAGYLVAIQEVVNGTAISCNDTVGVYVQ